VRRLLVDWHHAHGLERDLRISVDLEEAAEGARVALLLVRV